MSFVVGLMSGTSLDGIDAAVVEILDTEVDSNVDSSVDVNLVHFSTVSFSEEVKEGILRLCDVNQARIEDISAMNMLLGELFADAALQVISEAGLYKEDILLVSSHGQTIFHQPESIRIDGRDIASTLQIGDISVIAERTGILTIGDFRTRDMAVGGQGAPLVPYADFLLFKEESIGRVLLNIGGIANITVLPNNCTESDVLAYDTGPGNMMIDVFSSLATDGKQSYDKDGLLAAQGTVHEQWLAKLLEHPYFHLAAPKSTGREMFGVEYAKRLWDEGTRYGLNEFDKVATMTALTAKSIAKEIETHVETSHVKEVLVSGGGRYNHTLMTQLQNDVPSGVEVKGTDQYNMPADAKEAITFALLGYQSYNKRVNNIPAATGASKSVVMGKIAW